jgi:hypothetical protein
MIRKEYGGTRMLKKLLGGAGMVAAMWLAGAANVHALTFTDVFIPPGGPVLIDPYHLQYSYSHSILEEGFKLGESLHDVRLTLNVYDDAPPADKVERVMVDLEGQNYGTFVVTGTQLVITVNPALLKNDGILDVTLTRSKGDFFFKEATLVAYAPEPSTLMLLGSGLAGIAGLGFRRRQKANLA